VNELLAGLDRLAVEPSETAGAGGRPRPSDDAAGAIASAGSRTGTYEHPCPTCHAPAGQPCLRSPGRRGRRRSAWRRAPHIARLELGTTSFAHQGSPLGALSAAATRDRAA
jgi:hypothetical protein